VKAIIMTEAQGKELREASVRLAQALIAKEPTRKALMEKLGISRSYLSLLRSGHRIASLELCKKIQRVYPELTPLCIAIQMKKLDLF
jgi:DNA-binding Xre family transcriptional regulator